MTATKDYAPDDLVARLRDAAYDFGLCMTPDGGLDERAFRDLALLNETADRIESDARRLEAAEAALGRAKGCIEGLLARTPVRDVTETLAEIDAVLRSTQGEPKEEV